MRMMLRLASILAVVGLCSSAPLGDSVLLRLNYRVGDVLRYRMVQEQVMESELFGAIESETAFVWKNVVEKIDEQGLATLAVSYEGVRQQSEGPMPMSYDSRRKGDDAKLNAPLLAQMFDPLLQLNVSMEIEPNGHIRALHGVDKLLEAVTASMGDSAPAMKPMFESIFGEESLRRMWEVAVLPEEPVEPGFAWKREFEMELPMFGSMKVGFDQTFQGVEISDEKRCAKIDLKGAISFVVDEAMPFAVSVDSPKVEGWMLLALDDGAFQEMRQEMEMDLTFGPKDEAASMPPMEMSMTLSQHLQRIAADAPLFED